MSGQATGWVVVCTGSRAEKKVAQRMAALGHEVWLPLYTTRRRWSDRWREVELPLFPGYLFARASHDGWRELLRLPGVLTLLREAGAPARVADSLIQQLRTAIASPEAAPEPLEALHDFALEDEVIVQTGPLTGLRGRVTQLRGERRLVIWIAAVGKGLSCTIGAAQVARAT